jgi:replication-associated recombination protein RarA
VTEYLKRFRERATNDPQTLVADVNDVAGQAMILYGPAGSGKTTIARTIAKILNFHTIELNTSEDRRGF